MSDVIARECRPEDVEDMLSIRNAIFPPVTPDQWRATGANMTASVAYLGDEIVGAIPLDLRDSLAGPNAVIKTAYENAVGTREDMRSRGVGGAMIDAAVEFLADRVDMLMVYRGGERSIGYRFYRKTGHCDVLYTRTVTWQPPDGLSADIAMGDVADVQTYQDGIHAAFMATYAGYGGFSPRFPGYQAQQLAHQIYIVQPQDSYLFRYPSEGTLEAYAVCAIKTGQFADNVLQIQEIASLNGERPAQELLKGIGAEARKRDRIVSTYSCVDHPYRAVMERLGFVEGPRGMQIMAQPIRCEDLFRKTCVSESLIADLRINAWTPRRDLCLYEGPRAKREITIEAKEWGLTRLLSRRLDIRRAIEQDLISIRNGNEDIAARLGEAFPLAKWMYHHIDYI